MIHTVQYHNRPLTPDENMIVEDAMIALAYDTFVTLTSAPASTWKANRGVGVLTWEISEDVTDKVNAVVHGISQDMDPVPLYDMAREVLRQCLDVLVSNTDLDVYVHSYTSRPVVVITLSKPVL